MAQAQTDTFDVLSGATAVQADSGESDGSILVNGTFAKPGDQYKGMAGKDRVWTADALESAAKQMVGKPITKPLDPFEPHPGVRKTDSGLEVAPTPPIEAQIGTITDARVDDALGLVWQGTLDDEEVNRQVEAGRVDVSPVVGLETEARDDGVEEIIDTRMVRDLTAVTGGTGAAPGNSISPGAAEAMAAIDADALAQAFDGGPDSPTDDSNGGSDTDSNTSIMSDDGLTDKQQAIVAQANQLDDPSVIERADADRLNDADALLGQADDIDGEPVVIEKSEYDALTDDREEIKQIFADALSERTDLSTDFFMDKSVDALAGEFRDDDGNLEVDALTQTPVTGDPDNGDGGDNNDDGVDLDALSSDDVEEIQSLSARAETFDDIDGEHADALRADAAELAGVDDFEELETAEVI